MLALRFKQQTMCRLTMSVRQRIRICVLRGDGADSSIRGNVGSIKVRSNVWERNLRIHVQCGRYRCLFARERLSTKTNSQTDRKAGAGI